MLTSQVAYLINIMMLFRRADSSSFYMIVSGVNIQAMDS
jgi:hypothetical protein